MRRIFRGVTRTSDRSDPLTTADPLTFFQTLRIIIEMRIIIDCFAIDRADINRLPARIGLKQPFDYTRRG